jgi:hypothetical protein
MLRPNYGRKIEAAGKTVASLLKAAEDAVIKLAAIDQEIVAELKSLTETKREGDRARKFAEKLLKLAEED